MNKVNIEDITLDILHDDSYFLEAENIIEECMENPIINLSYNYQKVNNTHYSNLTFSNMNLLQEDKQLNIVENKNNSCSIDKLSSFNSKSTYCSTSNLISQNVEYFVNDTNKKEENIQDSCNKGTYESYVIQCFMQIKEFVPFFQSESYKNQIKSLKSKTELKIRKSKNKQIICFDLDETLIYSESVEDGLKGKKYDFILEEFNLGVVIRPGAKELISYCKSYNLDVYLFTAAEFEYAESIINQSGLDIQKDQILSREECIRYTHGSTDYYFKDVSILSREDTIIVDNLIVSFSSNLKNGVFVNSYDGSVDDDELYELKDYIDYLYCDSNESPIDRNEKFYCFQGIFNSLD